MAAYYNEHDPYAAQWLRNLIAAGHIAPGEVDERDIRDIHPDDLRGFTQCHFFAGIGVWSHALRRAGWADDRPVWTGSCPCQPFSAAGRRGGTADERHLWPHWFHLITERRPPTVLGEQVASKDGLAWLDLVQADLEGARYALGASDLCAAGFSGAHIRQRLYFVGLADSHHPRLEGRGEPGCERAAERPAWQGRVVGGLADAAGERHDGEYALLRQTESGRFAPGISEAPRRGADGDTYAPMLGRNPADWLYCRDGRWRPVAPGTFPLVDETPARVGRLRAYGNALDAETATEFVAAVMAAIADYQLVLDESATVT